MNWSDTGDQPSPGELKHAHELPPPVFVLAPVRSFTSVVCAMIGQHPQMYGLPETNLLCHATVGGDCKARGTRRIAACCTASSASSPKCTSLLRPNTPFNARANGCELTPRSRLSSCFDYLPTSSSREFSWRRARAARTGFNASGESPRSFRALGTFTYCAIPGDMESPSSGRSTTNPHVATYRRSTGYFKSQRTARRIEPAATAVTTPTSTHSTGGTIETASFSSSWSQFRPRDRCVCVVRRY